MYIVKKNPSKISRASEREMNEKMNEKGGKKKKTSMS